MAQVSVDMPTVPFGPHTISRLIVGGNQQTGNSHQSTVMGMQMREYFTMDRTVEFLKDCWAQGINAWQANYSEKTRDVLARLHDEGVDMNLIPISAPAVPDLVD